MEEFTRNLAVTHRLNRATVTSQFEPTGDGAWIRVEVSSPDAKSVTAMGSLNPCCRFRPAEAFEKRSDYVADFVTDFKDLFRGLDGDVRVNDDTIVVTYYNAPNESRLRQHYETLPDKLSQENIDPHLPWPYNFKLDFRFR